jgi:hypothetical protein
MRLRPVGPVTRKHRRPASLELEKLERRDLFSATPTIIAVTPADGSSLTTATPLLTVTYSEPMDVASATTPGNYLLFGSAGNSVGVTSVGLTGPDSSGHETATLVYNGSTTGLILDTYTLFVRGDKVLSNSTLGSVPMALPGQVVVANNGRTDASVINIPGNGSLGAISQYGLPANGSTSAGPVAVAMANLTGQSGENDLIVLNKSAGQIAIYLDQGGAGYGLAPSLTLTLSSTTEAGASAIILDKFSGGSLPDIVVADTTSGNVTAFQNQSAAGNLIFGAGQDFAAGTGPSSLASGDFDQDGKIDLIVGDTTADSTSNYDLTILPGLGTGNFFGTAQTLAIGNSSATTGIAPVSLATAFFDGDNTPDLVVGSNVANVAGVQVMLNTTAGAGKFSFKGLSPLTTNAVTNVAAGVVRVNSTPNKQADVVALDAVNSQVDVWYNAGSASVGSATFSSSAQTYGVGTNPQGLALAALVPGDSRLDIVLTQNTGDTTAGGSGALTLLQNIGTAGNPSFAAFSGSSSYSVDGNPVAVAAGDTNGDGAPDLVAVNNSTNDFTLLQGVGNGTFYNAGNTTLTPQLVAVATGDLNGDGIPDLIFAENAAKGASSVTVMLGQSGGGYGTPFTFLPSATGQTIRNVVSIAVGDVTGDGRPDIAVLDQQDATVGVLSNNISSATATLSTGSFIAQSQISLSTSGFFGTKVAAPTQILLAPFTSNAKSKSLDDILVSSLGASGGHFGGTPGNVVLLKNNTTPATGSTSFSFGSPGAVFSNLSIQAIAAGDFNGDGNLDFVAVYSNNGSGFAGVYIGDGTGKFTLQNNAAVTLDIASPVSVAVGDLNGDGYPDFVVAGSSTSTTAGGIDTVLNNFGTGFAKPVQTQVLPGTALQNVVIANLNNDAFPDLVVTTLPGNGGSTLDNVFALLNNGDGTYQSPRPYLAGGSSSPTLAPSYAVAVGNPLIRVTTFHSGGTTVNANLIVNGDFEAKDLNGIGGNLLGWQTYDLPNSPGGSYGAWNIQTGTTSPLSYSTVTAPAGKYQAMLDEPNQQPYSGNNNPNNAGSYAGSHALYQDISIPNNVSKVTVTLTLSAYNLASSWSDNTTAGAQILDYRNPSADQQVRVDIIDTKTGDILGSTGATGVLQNLFLSSSSTSLTFSQTVTADITAFHGQTVRLRIAETNNQGLLVVGVDNVKVNAIFNDTAAPSLTEVGLRNPGFTDPADSLVNGALPQHTTDATIIGDVGDLGSVNNLSFIEIDPNNTNFTGSAVYKINAWDPMGEFTFNIPTPLPGLQTVDLMVVNKAGSSASTTFTYFYQGPSLTDWQAYGPDAIDTTGQGVNYKSVSGSVTAIATDPSDPSGNTYYLGSINGGVWKTTDGGNDWTPLTNYVTDSKGNPVPVPIGALAVSKTVDTATNTYVVYAATGVGLNTLDARGGFGVLISTDGGQTWAVDGNSGTVLAGARVTSMVVDNDNPNIVYVAVAANASGAGGVYKTSNALNLTGATWTNVTSDTVMFTGSGTNTLSSSTVLQSVTSIIQDPFNTKRLIIGIGDIGLTSGGSSSSSGVWLTSNSGQSWILQSGGDGSISNSTLPSGSGIGRVTVAMGTGREGDENTVYVLFGTPPTSTTAPNFSYGGDYSGNAGTALYKSSNNMLDWTNVMLRINTGTQQLPSFSRLSLFGANAANSGALIVDPADVNVVYIGGSTRNSGGVGSTNQPFIRVDTGNMDAISGTNTGDDARKLASGTGNYYDPLNATDPYVGEGVYWYNLEQNVVNDGSSKISQLVPPNIQVLTFDSQGRLLIGTDSGIWRGVSYGYGYDFTSGGQGIIRAGKGQSVISPPGMTITALNGNLQIADLTSVAIDPSQFGVLYATMFNLGAAGSSGVLNWTSEALSGPTINGTNLGIITAGAIRVSSPPPTAPAGTPTTLFRVWEYANTKAVDPETSSDSGQNWSSINSTGIPVTNNPAGTFPAFVVNPTPFLNSGLFENQLLFGTNRVFITNTSGTVWDQFSPVLSSKGGLLTALAYAPSSDSVFFAGDNLGEVFATTNDGGTWNEVDTGLPTTAQVNAIVVDPKSAATAYVMFGASNSTTTIGHIFKTQDDGAHWSNITNNLPTSVTSANGMVIVPTSAGQSIYLATNVGVFVSTNGGSSWSRLGVGLPNVPVVDLEYNSTLGVLAAATQGSGVYTLSTDKTGANITAVAFGNETTTVSGSVTTTTVGAIDVTFNKPIDPRTVLLSDFAVTGPSNSSISLGSVVSLDPVNNEQFQINFSTPQSANGFYTLKVQPTIKDLVGNQMDQNQNGTNGENPGDVFSGRMLFEPNTNHAPALNSTSVTFNAVNEEGFNISNDSVGVALSSLVTGSPAAISISDVDSGAVKGIAITTVDDSNGTWQYSQDTGATWKNITGVGETNALLLQASANNMLRYVPGTSYQSLTVPVNNVLGTASFTFRAWDLTSGLDPLTGADGGFADTSSNGAATAFSSAEATATVQVLYDNHAPTFTVAGTSGGNQTVLESGNASPAFTTINSWATGLKAGPANEASQTLSFAVSNNNSGLFTSSGQPTITVAGNATAGFTGTLSYEQAQYANGTATVTVALQDNGGTANFGHNSSSSITFTIGVTPVNQPPSFTIGKDQTVSESASSSPTFTTVSGWATNISAGPSNESSQSVSFSLTSNNAALFATQPTVSSTGTLSFQQAQYANGSATVAVTLQDSGGTANGGQNTSSTQNFVITVQAVNQPPSFTVGADQTVLETATATAQTVNGWAKAISAGPSNESSQSVTFNVTKDSNTALFTSAGQPTVSSNGTLTYTPAAFANGSATITLNLKDTGGTANGGTDTSATQSFVINVTPVNQPPSFTAGADQTVTSDFGPSPVAVSVPGWATNVSAGPANESSQTLNFLVSDNNPGLFGVQPAVSSNGTLTFTPAAFANGTAQVTVAVHDSGGTSNGGVDTSASITFNINFSPSDQPPNFTGGGNQSATVYDGQHTVPGWATNISAGPAVESWQTVSFVVSSDNPALFNVQPAVSSNGTLTYSPGRVSGTANVTVTATDNGGSATSGPFKFTITVTPFVTSGTSDAVWVAQVYRDVLGREIQPGEVDMWTGLMGSGLSRLTAAQEITQSDEYRTNFGQGLYETYLGRAMDVVGSNYVLQLFHGGATEDQVKASILQSDEYNRKNGSSVNGFLTGLYRDVLGTAADAGGLAFWGGKMAGGMTRYQVALAFLQTASADAREVQLGYLQLLGRGADAMGLTYWTGQLQGGDRDEDFYANLIASGEYGLNATAHDYNVTPDENWLNQVFMDTLGRPIDAGGTGYFINQIRMGVERPAIVQTILSSAEYQKDLVLSAFSTILRRAPSFSELTNYEGMLALGTTDEQMKAMLYGSPEYFNNRGGGTNAGFLQALYGGALGRPLDDTGFSTWAPALNAGTTTTQTVALSVLTSQEGYAKLVRDGYQRFLRRGGDDGGVNYWVGALMSGMTDEAFYANLLASSEYYNKFAG